MTRRVRPAATLFCALAIVLSVSAQTAGAADWFEVEFILFSRPGATGTDEALRLDRGIPDWGDARPLQPGITPPLYRRLERGAAAGAYQLLPESALQLAGAAGALRRSRGYSPVLHLAWRQPIGSARSAEPLYVQWPAGGSGFPEIQGLIELSLNRYLHVDVDFVWNDDPVRGAGDRMELTGQSRGPIRFQASRRMRSGELHYLDHPKMGMLIEIRRYGQPDAAPAGSETGEEAEPAEEAIPEAPEAQPAPPGE